MPASKRIESCSSVVHEIHLSDRLPAIVLSRRHPVHRSEPHDSFFPSTPHHARNATRFEKMSWDLLTAYSASASDNSQGGMVRLVRLLLYGNGLLQPASGFVKLTTILQINGGGVQQPTARFARGTADKKGATVRPFLNPQIHRFQRTSRDLQAARIYKWLGGRKLWRRY